MSSGETHEDINIIAAFIISLFFIIFKLPLDILVCLNYGLVIRSLWYSCDLDKENSRPIKRWGPFKVIWRAFYKAGHREVLHSVLWGTVILCIIPSITTIPVVYFTGYYVVLWSLVGLVLSVELHIFIDKVTGVKKWKLFKLLKKTIGYLKVTRFWGKSRSSRKVGQGLREY